MALKDRSETVVSGFRFRAGPTSSRTRRLVVRREASCLGDGGYVGRFISGLGSEDGIKRVLLME